ncbi:Rad52/Rad22 family DNA repair protein [Paenimyroides ceti]
MEVKTIDKTLRDKLRAPLPNQATKPHPTKTFLTSIKPIYITERLNDVFGVGKWTTKVDHITTTDKSMVVIKVIFEVKEYGIYHECYGGNDNGGENSKNFDLGDAFKGATTDAITKIASYLEIGIDIFKGDVKTSTQSNGNQNQMPTPEKWLNILDIEKNFTNEWTNILKGIAKGTVTSVSDVRKHYKVSKEVEQSLLEQLNQK